MRRDLPAAVLFDMDGLLIDSERMALASLEHAACEIGQVIPHHVALRLIGLSRDNADAMLLRWLGADFPVDDFAAAWLCDYQQRVAQGVPAKPGAVEALGALAAAGIRCAVATSTATALARHKLEMSGLLAHFAAVVGRDAVRTGKPAPDLYLLAAARLDALPSDCWAFEDSLPGLHAALGAGARTHWIPDLAEIAPHELPHGVETVSSLHEICRWISPVVR